MASSNLALTTIMMCLLFGTNALLCLLFQVIKFFSRPTEEIRKKDHKELSKPFTGSVECFTNLTLELFRTSLIMLLTYICEKHWIFEHSGKTYSRDLFMFVILVFFAYGIYTIQPVTDLTLLSREQTEEWKGWMQFIFLLYHYFHAEEVYNSVRVMITCYVWMTGFGNFSFFYVKQDYGWLRVVQMLWRLNFSVLLLMWTHGNTWILYYICPMHTFFFLMVYVTMYVFSSWNYDKWGIRVKLMVLAVIIFLVWDVNGGLFDFLFGWLGTSSVVGANNGSVWEYYFRTSLDHWSSFLGMLFAVNFPLTEQFFTRAKGWPLVVTAVLMASLFGWWFLNYYTLDKLSYNLSHSYFAIIPLTVYIFFRNITPTVRSGVSMSMHDLGKTTLETYLLQHHIWLTSNAKTLLTITPGYPWINFALASILFFVVSKELYRLTMSLRGMMVPDDKQTAWNNCIGMGAVILVLYVIANMLFMFESSFLEIFLGCLGLALISLLIINRFARQTADNFVFQQWSGRAAAAFVLVLIAGLALQLVIGGHESLTTGADLVSPPGYAGTSTDCLSSISHGHWVTVKCVDPPAPQLNKAAFCETEQWVWDSEANSDPSCPVAKLSVPKAKGLFKNKKILFIGDSILRGTYHQFNKMIDSSYKQKFNATLKHSDLVYNAAQNTTIQFVWAPMTQNITDFLQSGRAKMRYDLVVAGAAAWDALYERSVDRYVNHLNVLAGAVGNTKAIWVQPTTVLDGRLSTPEKQQYMTEARLKEYRQAAVSSQISKAFQAIIATDAVSAGREGGSADGIHYGEEVYAVIAQMTANAYALHFPSFYVVSRTIKQLPPKRTGAMSFPSYGLIMLAVTAVMLVTMDSFFGIGYLGLRLFDRSMDWEAAYSPLHKKLFGGGRGGGGSASGSLVSSPASTRANSDSEPLLQEEIKNANVDISEHKESHTV